VADEDDPWIFVKRDPADLQGHHLDRDAEGVIVRAKTWWSAVKYSRNRETPNGGDQSRDLRSVSAAPVRHPLDDDGEKGGPSAAIAKHGGEGQGYFSTE